MKTSRLIDIAKRAKVSPTTVSRVINKSPIPRLETKEKVMEVIRQMNYVPNLMARNLARGRYKKRHKTDNIGFLVSGIPRSSFMMDDGFYSRIFFGIEKETEAEGHHVIFSVLDSEVSEFTLPSVVQDMKVDGVVVAGAVPQELIKRISEHIPVVLINYYRPDVHASSVMPDNNRGIHEMVSHLYRLGHRKIGFFGLKVPDLPSVWLHHRQRLEAYRRCIRALGLIEEEDYCRLPEVSALDEKEALESLAEQTLKRLINLPRPPTAIICPSDFHALFLLKIIRKHGLRVPEDISISGFDDLPSAGHSQPGLTSIRMPMEDMGRTGVKLLFETMENPDYIVRSIVLNVQLIVRESTASLCRDASSENRR
jgi:DNA-binding LacI/PurR family transcriptional regulator